MEIGEFEDLKYKIVVKIKACECEKYAFEPQVTSEVTETNISSPRLKRKEWKTSVIVCSNKTDCCTHWLPARECLFPIVPDASKESMNNATRRYIRLIFVRIGRVSPTSIPPLSLHLSISQRPAVKPSVRIRSWLSVHRSSRELI